MRKGTRRLSGDNRQMIRRVMLIAVGLGILAAAGGMVYLGTRTIPANSTLIEKVIPNDRFPR